jgi:O-antigen ligase
VSFKPLAITEPASSRCPISDENEARSTRMGLLGLAIVLGITLGGLLVHVPSLYLFLGIGGLVFGVLLLFKIEVAVLLGILLRNWLDRYTYLGGGTAMHPNGAIGIAIIGGAALFFLLNGIDPRRLRGFWAFLGFTLVSLFSLAFAGDYLMDGLTVALRLVTALAIYAVLIHKLDSRAKINWVIAAVIAAQIWPTIEGLSGVAQRGGLSLSSAEIVRLGHSGQGALLAMILAFCLVQFLGASTHPRRFLWGGLSSLFAVGLFFSYGRAGWIGFGVTVMVIGLMKHRKLLVVFPLLLILLIALSPLVARRFSDVDIGRLDDRNSSTLAQRVEIWQGSMDVYEARPLLGVGYGTGRYRVGEYLGQYAWMTHNDYLEVLLETGLIGFVLFMLWQGQWLVQILQVYREAEYPYDKVLALAVVAMLLASLVVRVTDNVLQTTEKLYPLAALVAATLALPRIRAGEEARGSVRSAAQDPAHG